MDSVWGHAAGGAGRHIGEEQRENQAVSEVKQELSRLMDQLASIKASSVKSTKDIVEEPASSVSTIRPDAVRAAYLSDCQDEHGVSELPKVMADVMMDDSDNLPSHEVESFAENIPGGGVTDDRCNQVNFQRAFLADLAAKKGELLSPEFSHSSICKKQLQVEESRVWQLWTKAKWSALYQAQETIQDRKEEEAADAAQYPQEFRSKRRSLVSPLTSVIQNAVAHSNTIKRLDSRGSNASSVSHVLQAARKQREHLIFQFHSAGKTMTIELTLFFATVYVLYIPDLYFAADPPTRYDKGMYSIEFVCFVAFAVDFVAQNLLEPVFMFSFYFWLDALGLLALIPDVVYLFTSERVMPNSDYLIIARAARIGRVSTKAAKLMQGLDSFQGWRRGNSSAFDDVAGNSRVRSGGTDHGTGNSNDVNGANDDSHNPTLSRPATLSSSRRNSTNVKYRRNSTNANSVRKHSIYEETPEEYHGTLPTAEGVVHARSRMEATVQHHVFASVALTLILCISIVSLLVSAEAPDAIISHARSLGTLLVGLDWNTSDPLLSNILGNLTTTRGGQNSILYIEVGGVPLFGSPDTLGSYRPSFASELVVQDFCCGDGSMRIHLDRSRDAILAAWSNLIVVTGVLFIVPIVTAMMMSSARQDFITPLERLNRIIDGLKINPLAAVEIEFNTPNGLSELASIERALVKLSSLLQMGFGEAGAQIIASSLDPENDLDIDAVGKRVHAFFGFCDIRNFTDCTEVLQEEVVKLVNNVGSIVHNAVVANHGAPNKNIGDAFLLVWKPKSKESIDVIADSALRSYLTTILEMQRDLGLKAWAERPGIQRRLPGYTVKLGFGLHFGWAVECTIGSHHKIDASYLSPHVNLASRLEAATKQYGVELLISGETHQLFSHAVKDLCRYVDRVVVKGSNKPMCLYTYDCPSLSARGGDLEDMIDLGKDALEMPDFFRALAPRMSKEFIRAWGQGMVSYLGGHEGKSTHWRNAALQMEICLQIKPDDGPATAILAHINAKKTSHGDAPADWPGYRSLTEK